MAGNSSSVAARNASKEAEKKMNQTQFNVDELLQVFSSANLGNGTRRRPKASTYSSLHDSVISQHQNVCGLYPFNTFKIRPEFLGCPSIEEVNPTYTDNAKAQETGDQENVDKQSNGALTGAGASADKDVALRKVDYLEYMERDGRAVLDFMMDNAEEIEKRTSVLRTNLSQA